MLGVAVVVNKSPILVQRQELHKLFNSMTFCRAVVPLPTPSHKCPQHSTVSLPVCASTTMSSCLDYGGFCVRGCIGGAPPCRGRLGNLVSLKYYYNEQSQGILTQEDLKSSTTY